MCVCNPLAALHVRTQKKEKQNQKESLGVEKKEMRKQNTGRSEWLVLQLPGLKDPRVHCVFSRSTGQTGADGAAAARCFLSSSSAFFPEPLHKLNLPGPTPVVCKCKRARKRETVQRPQY